MRSEALHGAFIPFVRTTRMETAASPADLLLRSLAEGDMSVLDSLYDTHRVDFLRWAGQRFQVKNRDDLLDAWHDTMIMFYEQVRDRKLVHMTCEIKTYLFTIGYRRLLRIFKKNEKFELTDDFHANTDIDESINVKEHEEIMEQQSELVKEAISQIPEKGRRILVMRFLEGKSIPEIRQAMGYESENAVSVTLSRSLDRLKKLITDRKSQSH